MLGDGEMKCVLCGLTLIRMIRLLCGTLVRDPHKMRRPMNSETSFIASAPSKGQARRKQESRNSEVSLSQRTTCSETVGGKMLMSSYQVTNPLSTSQNHGPMPLMKPTVFPLCDD